MPTAYMPMPPASAWIMAMPSTPTVTERMVCTVCLLQSTLAFAAVPPSDVLEAEHAVIGEIFVDNANIFDPEIPEEDRALHRFANTLHFRTRLDA